jgi:hypothetical protein
MTRVVALRLSALAGAVAMLTSSSCGDGLGPITVVTPQIELLVSSASAPPVGILSLTARLTDVDGSLRPNDRIPLRVSVAGGDEETMGMGPEVCFRTGPTLCTGVSVLMKDGHTTNEIGTALGGIWARWWIVGSRQTWGGLWVFDPREVDRAILALRRHPAVSSAEYEGLGSPAGSIPGEAQVSWARLLLASMPLDYAAAKPNDGKVQGVKGALMTVRYTQPDGSELTQTFAIP